MSSITSSLPIASPSVLPPNPSDRIRSVLNLVQAVNALDIPRICAYFSDDVCTVQIFPEDTLKGMGKLTALNKAGLERELTKVKDILKEPELIIREIIESEFANKVVVHVKGQGSAHDGQAFTMEFILNFTFGRDSNGEAKIVEYRAFVDSLHFQDFFGPGPVLQA